MPLTRHEIAGHDEERLAFRFSMLNEEQIVQCQISDVALDELAGMEGTESSARAAQFLSLRDTIERMTSRLFDEAPRSPGYVVRIFSKHVRSDFNWKGRRKERQALDSMLRKPIEIPPVAARAFMRDLKAFFKEKDPHKRDLIAGDQMRVLWEHQRPGDKRISILHVKEMFHTLRNDE